MAAATWAAGCIARAQARRAAERARRRAELVRALAELRRRWAHGHKM